MFYNCNNLNDIDISNINTKNSKTFEGIFYNGENINEINKSNLKYNAQNPIDDFLK